MRSAVWRRQVGVLAVVVSMAAMFWLGTSTGERAFAISQSWCVNIGMRAIGLLLLAAGVANLALYLTGFVVEWRKRLRCHCRRESGAPSVAADGEVLSKGSRPLAVVMAVFNEDPQRIDRAVRVMARSFHEHSLDAEHDFFLLSDTDDDEIRIQEERMVHGWQQDLVGTACVSGGQEEKPRERSPARYWLVRRGDRVNFKAGNIANFLARHGGGYEFILVLDADSVILGGSVRAMLDRMRRQPNLGILQSTILPIGSTTPFAMAMEHSIGRCLPLYASGMCAVFGDQCVYWGHNAMIRVQAFLRHGALPILPGGPPFGGSILSHDIVEAALLGRAGYAVAWDTRAEGSYDMIPPEALSYGRRDRRWCSGNIQHFWMIFGDLVRPWHRVYFANGICSYLTGPMILAMTGLGWGRSAQSASHGMDWGVVFVFGALLAAFVGIPKALGLWRLSWRLESERQGNWSRRLKWWLREGASTLGELGFSLLMAPSMFYLHARYVVEILFGARVVWKSQRRHASSVLGWGEVARVFGVPTVLGVVWMGLSIAFAPHALVFVMPIVAGWLLSIPMAVWSSSPSFGAKLARWGIWGHCLTPAECAELGGLGVGGTGGRSGGDLPGGLIVPGMASR